MSAGGTAATDHPSPFALAGSPGITLLQTEGRIRYLILSGRQDDGLWGPIGALWLSKDGRRGGFLVNPWAVWEGSELVRGYRSALDRGWTPSSVYGYWQREVWPRSHTIDEEREIESLFLLNELVAAL